KWYTAYSWSVSFRLRDSIRADSRVRSAATFSIRFPLSRAPFVPSSGAVAASPPSLRSEGGAGGFGCSVVGVFDSWAKEGTMARPSPAVPNAAAAKAMAERGIHLGVLIDLSPLGCGSIVAPFAPTNGDTAASVSLCFQRHSRPSPEVGSRGLGPSEHAGVGGGGRGE